MDPRGNIPFARQRPTVPSHRELTQHYQVLSDAVITLSKRPRGLSEIIKTTPDFLFELCPKFTETAAYFEALAEACRLAEMRIVEAAIASDQ